MVTLMIKSLSSKMVGFNRTPHALSRVKLKIKSSRVSKRLNPSSTEL